MKQNYKKLITNDIGEKLIFHLLIFSICNRLTFSTLVFCKKETPQYFDVFLTKNKRMPS